MRNYRDEVKAKGGKVLYECKAPDCGGHPTKNILGDFRMVSLPEYLLPFNRVSDPERTPGWCAVYSEMGDTRYMVAELPSEGTHISVLTYALPDPAYCPPLRGRTFAMVDVVSAKARENKMVTVRAADMAEAITSKGKVALYGIYFDSGKADVKPTSDATLEQMGKLLKENPKLKLLVVGHTDNAGPFKANLQLSQRRAAAVVNALATRYGIKKDRLTPVGVSFAAPLDSNRTDAGRAKNRRVELVEN
jgi:outer membrane protein OmpA-like peptidoglycan-associated protein